LIRLNRSLSLDLTDKRGSSKNIGPMIEEMIINIIEVAEVVFTKLDEVVIPEVVIISKTVVAVIDKRDM
jgi:hypothetical protein